MILADKEETEFYKLANKKKAKEKWKANISSSSRIEIGLSFLLFASE